MDTKDITNRLKLSREEDFHVNDSKFEDTSYSDPKQQNYSQIISDWVKENKINITIQQFKDLVNRLS